MEFSHNGDTICALASPPGRGAISVIRVSGPLSKDIVLDSVLNPRSSIKPRYAYYDTFLNSEAKPIDDLIWIYYEESKSFTGEASVEVFCHGNPFIVKEILNHFIALGCRLAKPGEFSYRAFMNQKMDLTQAEAIHSLISANNHFAKNLALNQLHGSLSDRLNKLDELLTFILANFEAEIDFSTEDIEVQDLSDTSKTLSFVLSEVQSLLSYYAKTDILENALQVAIVGAPNAGKSSLLNRISNSDTAIVSDIPGTTRDLVKFKSLIKGFPVEWVDTAGIRESNDPIEILGIQKTYKSLNNSDILIYLIDLRANSYTDELNKFKSLDHPRKYLVYTKNDLSLDIPVDGVSINNKSEEGIQPILDIIDAFLDNLQQLDDLVLVQSRHFALLKDAERAILKTLEMLSYNESPDFISFELQLALNAIYEILGKKWDDQVMDRVFQEFCLGK